MAVELVGLRVLHHAGHLGDKVIRVAGPPQEVEAHLHAGRDPACGDDGAPGVIGGKFTVGISVSLL